MIILVPHDSSHNGLWAPSHMYVWWLSGPASGIIGGNASEIHVEPLVDQDGSSPADDKLCKQFLPENILMA